MKYTIQTTSAFKKSFKRCIKRGLDENVLLQAVTLLATNGCLPESYRTHPLRGKYAGLLECHLMPDWLLVWQQNDTTLLLILVDTGSHSDLFG